jgi:hypothetical protein
MMPAFTALSLDGFCAGDRKKEIRVMLIAAIYPDVVSDDPSVPFDNPGNGHLPFTLTILMMLRRFGVLPGSGHCP